MCHPLMPSAYNLLAIINSPSYSSDNGKELTGPSLLAKNTTHIATRQGWVCLLLLDGNTKGLREAEEGMEGEGGRRREGEKEGDAGMKREGREDTEKEKEIERTNK